MVTQRRIQTDIQTHMQTYYTLTHTCAYAHANLNQNRMFIVLIRWLDDVDDDVLVFLVFGVHTLQNTHEKESKIERERVKNYIY